MRSDCYALYHTPTMHTFTGSSITPVVGGTPNTTTTTITAVVELCDNTMENMYVPSSSLHPKGPDLFDVSAVHVLIKYRARIRANAKNLGA